MLLDDIKKNGSVKKLDDDPFIKRLHDLKGVYDGMKRQIHVDSSTNYFENIKKENKVSDLKLDLSDSGLSSNAQNSNSLTSNGHPNYG